MKSYKIIRPSELSEAMGLSTVTIWRMQKRGELPPRKKYSNGIVGWRESVLDEWFESRPYADPSAQAEAENE